MNLSLDEFITLDIQTSGKRVYLLADVIKLAQEWRLLSSQNEQADPAFRSDPEIDALLGIARPAPDRCEVQP